MDVGFNPEPEDRWHGARGVLPADRSRQFSVVVVDGRGRSREIIVEAHDFGEAGFLAHAEMGDGDTIDSITD